MMRPSRRAATTVSRSESVLRPVCYSVIELLSQAAQHAQIGGKTRAKQVPAGAETPLHGSPGGGFSLLEREAEPMQEQVRKCFLQRKPRHLDRCVGLVEPAVEHNDGGEGYDLLP